MQVSELDVPRGESSAQQPGQRPVDWQPLLRSLAACPTLRELSLRDPHISRAAALELTALTQLQLLVVCGADEYVQERLTASLGAHCALHFLPLT
jgi:hypothetical protein